MRHWKDPHLFYVLALDGYVYKTTNTTPEGAFTAVNIGRLRLDSEKPKINEIIQSGELPKYVFTSKRYQMLRPLIQKKAEAIQAAYKPSRELMVHEVATERCLCMEGGIAYNWHAIENDVNSMDDLELEKEFKRYEKRRSKNAF